MHLDSSVVKGDWTTVEDETLLRLQAIHGNKWQLISDELPGRPCNDVKNRYHFLVESNRRRSRKRNRHRASALPSLSPCCTATEAEASVGANFTERAGSVTASAAAAVGRESGADEYTSRVSSTSVTPRSLALDVPWGGMLPLPVPCRGKATWELELLMPPWASPVGKDADSHDCDLLRLPSPRALLASGQREPCEHGATRDGCRVCECLAPYSPRRL